MSKQNRIDCQQALKHLFEYLDQQLDGEQEEQMRQHMHDCRSCFSRLEFERLLKSHVRDTGDSEAPESLRQRVANLINAFNKDH
jgi:mycothiol system anti-sigma-R factor